MISDVDKAYTAGIVDGEGYIAIMQVDGRFRVRVEVGSTSECLIEWIHQLYGGFFYMTEPKNKKWKPVYRFMIQGRKSRALLEDVLPYLKIKKNQCKIALRLLDTLVSNGELVDDQTLVLRMRLTEKMKELNAVGTS